MRPSNRRNGRQNRVVLREPACFEVEEETRLLDFLIAVFPEKSRTSVKSYLSHRQVAVNQLPTSRFDVSLYPGDVVSVLFDRSFKSLSHPQLKLVYEDDQLIVVNKAYGLLTISTEREKSKTAYRILSDYVKQEDPRNRIFVLHRLDKDTSGLLMFAKSKDIQSDMQLHWSEMIVDRRYVAVIEGCPDREEGEISSYLSENTAYKMYVSTAPDAKFALTRFRVLKTNNRYTLVELDLQTGRKNQIRVHMEQIGHSIAGDRKYGAKSNPLGRMALHASKLRFIHPVTHQELNFETPIPSKFQLLVRRSSKNG